MVETQALKSVFTSSLKLKAEESCLIVTDTIKESIGRDFYNYAASITPFSKIIVIEPTKEHSSEPPEEVAKEMLKFGVQLLITAKSLTHTKARREASAKGRRIATMPDVTEDICNRCLGIDYAKLKNESMRLYTILGETKKVRVTTDLGTDMIFEIGDSGFFGKDGGCFDYPGAYGNLPEGEVSFAPGNCQGSYIVDASFPDIGILDTPLTFKVRDGLVYEISGGRSQEIIARLDKAGSRAWKVAELGIGLNPKAKISGNILEDEKVIGTVHIALGNNLSYGGTNDVPLHLDGVILKPDIFLDDRKIMQSGKFSIL